MKKLHPAILLAFALSIVSASHDVNGQARTPLPQRPDLVGVVLLPSGQPATGAFVGVGTDRQARVIVNGEFRVGTRPDPSAHQVGADGRFTIPVAPIDRDVEVVAVHAEGTAVITEKELRQTQTLKLKPWTVVTGILKEGNRILATEPVRFFNGAVPGGLKVVFSERTVTGADGRFRLEKVPVGDFEVAKDPNPKSSIQEGSILRGVATVTTKAGIVSDVVIGGTGRPIAGKITIPAAFKSRVPRGNFWVSPYDARWATPANFDRMSPEQKRAWTDRRNANPEWVKYVKTAHVRSQFVKIAEDGTFRAEDIVEGDYTFFALIQDLSNPLPGGRSPTASGELRFTVPPMPGGRSDEPLDIGTVRVQRVQ